MGGQAESSVSVQIDVYAGTVTQARQIRQDAREAIMLLARDPSVKCRTNSGKPLLPCNPGVSGHGVTFSFFYKTHTPPRAGFLLSGGRMSALYERSQLTQVDDFICPGDC